MENQVKSLKTLRQRKFYFVLPALVMPFITLMFWAFGGGKVEESSAQNHLKTGLMASLPQAALKEDHLLNKLDFYNQAQADSMKLRELIKNDPNYMPLSLSRNSSTFPDVGLNTSLNGDAKYNDANEEKIYKKLAQLDRELKNSYEPPLRESYTSFSPVDIDSGSADSQDIERLEQMMTAMTQPMAEDQEVKQLNRMLETILDIQHPERLEQRLKQNPIQQEGVAYPVLANTDELPVSLISASVENSRFYSINDTLLHGSTQNAIEAVIHEDQTLVNGSTVKLRLLVDIMINGVVIPKDNFIFGVAQLNGERLAIKISNIRFDQTLLPVELSVYDLDGLNGIYIPGSITRESARESTDRSLQTIGLNSLDPSWGAQAAGVGVEAVKTLLSRKVKLVKVTVKAGYKVLLRDGKQKIS